MLLEELGRSYQIAAKAYLDCRNSPRQSLLHEFRKKSKTLLYQLYYFRPLNQPAIKSLEKKLDYLTQNLGKYNDLAQITDMIGYKYGDPGNSAVMDELAVVIRDKQDRYLSKVWPLAYRIFAPGKNPQRSPEFYLLQIEFNLILRCSSVCTSVISCILFLTLVFE